jgi:hypothetical protein
VEFNTLGQALGLLGRERLVEALVHKSGDGHGAAAVAAFQAAR